MRTRRTTLPWCCCPHELPSSLFEVRKYRQPCHTHTKDPFPRGEVQKICKSFFLHFLQFSILLVLHFFVFFCIFCIFLESWKMFCLFFAFFAVFWGLRIFPTFFYIFANVWDQGFTFFSTVLFLHFRIFKLLKMATASNEPEGSTSPICDDIVKKFWFFLASQVFSSGFAKIFIFLQSHRSLCSILRLSGNFKNKTPQNDTQNQTSKIVFSRRDKIHNGQSFSWASWWTEFL